MAQVSSFPIYNIKFIPNFIEPSASTGFENVVIMAKNEIWNDKQCLLNIDKVFSSSPQLPCVQHEAMALAQ